MRVKLVRGSGHLEGFMPPEGAEGPGAGPACPSVCLWAQEAEQP